MYVCKYVCIYVCLFVCFVGWQCVGSTDRASMGAVYLSSMLVVLTSFAWRPPCFAGPFRHLIYRYSSTSGYCFIYDVCLFRKRPGCSHGVDFTGIVRFTEIPVGNVAQRP